MEFKILTLKNYKMTTDEKKVTFRKLEFPLKEEDFLHIYETLADKKYDVAFLDRALIMQFKALPGEPKIVNPIEYIELLTSMLLTSIYMYEYDTQQQHSETTED